MAGAGALATGGTVGASGSGAGGKAPLAGADGISGRAVDSNAGQAGGSSTPGGGGSSSVSGEAGAVGEAGSGAEAGNDSGGQGGDGGAGGGGGASGAGGTLSLGGNLNLGGSGGSGNVCGGVGPIFAPQESNVLLLVDRSGTMFAGTGATVWDRVRDALLPSIQAVAAQQSVGFLAVGGEFGACSPLEEVAPAKNNYAAIASKYSALGKPVKGESPFPLALDRAAQLLAGKQGDKYIILIIDGEPDYCDDGFTFCAVDSTVVRLQKLREAGVTTLVAPLPFPVGLPQDVTGSRQSYANAGAGLPAAIVGGTEYSVYYTCPGSSAYVAEHAASGKPAEKLLATYSDAPGSAPFTELDPSDTGGLRASFGRLLAGTRSCRFDVQGREVVVEAAKTRATVSMNGQALPFSAQNGWNLPSSKVVELTGSACTAYRGGSAAQLEFAFPCSVLK